MVGVVFSSAAAWADELQVSAQTVVPQSGLASPTSICRQIFQVRGRVCSTVDLMVEGHFEPITVPALVLPRPRLVGQAPANRAGSIVDEVGAIYDQPSGVSNGCGGFTGSDTALVVLPGGMFASSACATPVRVACCGLTDSLFSDGFES